MVGGVTPSELRLIREVVASHKPGSQVSQESDLHPAAEFIFSLVSSVAPAREKKPRRPDSTACGVDVTQERLVLDPKTTFALFNTEK